MSWEASETHNAAKKAQLGFGFHKDGTLSLPERLIQNAPIVINDAIVPNCLPEESTLDHLAALCCHGCFFDFERPASKWSTYLIKSLKMKCNPNVLFAVPQSYAEASQSAVKIVLLNRPINNWTRFCKHQHEAYGCWAWEIIPCKKTVPISFNQKLSNEKIKNTNYRCCKTQNSIVFYDTMETIKSKLEIAAYYGCIAGIGLYSELDEMEKPDDSPAR